MSCGCTDNKNLKDKINLEYTKDLPIGTLKDITTLEYTKDLSIEAIKNLSIEAIKGLSLDEIIRLYQDGYKIETMQYSNYCSGTVSIDRSNTSGTAQGIWLSDAYAQKVNPTSKCLKSVILSLADDSYHNDMYVEIRRDSGGLPNGNPQSSGNLGNVTIPGSSISTYPNFGDVTVNLNILLSDSDVTNGVWIVVCSQFYDPNSGDITFYHYTKTGASGTTNEHMAFKSATLPWQGFNNSNLYFKTNKQIYSLPANITATAITATPSVPCIEGTCTVNINVTWQNTGGVAGSFVPNISIDNIPVSPAPYPSESVGGGLTTTHTFVVTGLTKAGSPHNICPFPN